MVTVAMRLDGDMCQDPKVSGTTAENSEKELRIAFLRHGDLLCVACYDFKGMNVVTK